jgi:HemY protein
MRTLAAMAKDKREGAIALAGAAIDAHEWGEAREALKPYLGAGLTQRICMLMAELEEGEHGDAGRGRAWLSRAVRAPRDPAWTADGVVSEAWAPVSPVTGRLDAFEWRVPFEALAPPSPDLFGDPEADIDALVLPMHVAGPTKKAADAGMPGPKPAAQGEQENKTDKGDKSKAEAGGEGKKEAPPEDLFATHAPDDPGPEGDVVKDEDAELQRGG